VLHQVAPLSDHGAEHPHVSCPAGRIAGRTLPDAECDRFLGIPYAAPPIGSRRFKPARPHEGWEGVFDANAFGAASAQVFDPHEADFVELDDGPLRKWAGDEDSLTLNIWSPRNGGRSCPVVIWIHGGANWLEASRLPIYDGARFAHSGIVFVSFNYRLGIFGFLDLSPIGGPKDAHSNGLTDQLAAIEWVRDNIAAFGGDANNITLMGDSAGSMDISWLIASQRLPAAVHRVVLMSGVASVVGLGWDGQTSAHDAEEGTRRAAEFLEALGYRTLAQLAAASTSEILDRQAAYVEGASVLLDMDTLFYPRVGAVSATDPFVAAHEGAGAGLDVIIGFTAYEMGLWLLWDDALDQRPLEWAAAAAPHIPQSARDAIAERYRAWFPDVPEGIAGMHLLGDSMFAMPSLWFADLLSRSGAKVYCYRFDWQANDRVGALHAADQAFLFGQANTAAGAELLGEATDAVDIATRDELGDIMHQAFVAFMRAGKPDREWPRWSPTDRAMRLFGGAAPIVHNPMAERRMWWSENILPRRFGGGA
jgi:para-nitrobenzyl esterase